MAASRAAKEQSQIVLPGGAPGTSRQLTVLRWRGRAGPRVYIQAALHGDEIPPLLVAHHLERLIDAALPQLRGEILLLPYANPFGLDQFVQGQQHGRFDLDSGQNFNRGFAELGDPLAEKVAERLGADPAANVAEIRAALRELLAGPLPPTPQKALRHALLRLAVDCDIVLDLHCENEACLHLYVNRAHWPQAADLAHALQAEMVLLADDSGGDCFDEACLRPYTTLAARFPQHPVPAACFATTVELRGERDVDDDTARIDAEGLMRFLRARGVFAGGAELPTELPRATRLEALDLLEAPATGVLLWERPLGCEVAAGELLGWIVVPGEPGRIALRARTAGLLLARRGQRFVRAGQVVCKVAGEAPLDWRRTGALMVD